MNKKLKYIFIEKKSTKNTLLNSGSISFGEVIYKNDDKITELTKDSYQEVLNGEFLINPLNLNFDFLFFLEKSVLLSHGHRETVENLI